MRTSAGSETGSRYQVNGDGGSQDPSEVDVNGVVPELDDSGQSGQDGQHDEGEHQERLQELRRVGQNRVEVHLEHSFISNQEPYTLTSEDNWANQRVGIQQCSKSEKNVI